MYQKFLFVLMLIYSNSNAKPNPKIFRADYKYIEATQAFYKFHTTPTTWNLAKQMCESEGATLFYPKNAAEAQAVISFRREHQYNAEWIYIGINDFVVKRDFATIDGKNLTYLNWRAGEPNNARGTEDCVMFNTDGTFNDHVCDENHSYICKKALHELEPQNPCHIPTADAQPNPKTFRADYKYIEATHAFYKFHTTATTWNLAKQMCETEGATLFYPKNAAEAQAVISFWKENQNNPEWIYIGINDFVVKRDFAAIDGKNLTYLNWRSGEPNNARGTEDCVMLYTDGTFNDHVCNENYPYICKKTLHELERKNPCHIPKTDAQPNSKIFRADYKFIEATQAFYKVHTTATTWNLAKQMCETEGATLFYPKNATEAQAVISFWKEYQNNAEWIYIGINDFVVKGDFATIDGKPLTYLNWCSGEPNNAREAEDCVMFHTDGTFNNHVCNENYPYICKKNLYELEWKSPCNIPNADYIYNKEEGNCYKFYKTAMSWTDAYKKCNHEQSHLAVINSKKERDYLLGLTLLSTDQVTEVLPKGKVHLGFHNRLGEGWQTLQGTALIDSGYADWDVRQPDGVSQGEKCGSMSYGGKLHDVECNTKTFFICEHELDRKVFKST